jgi:hypothetical protein
MSTIHFKQATTATSEQYIAGLTDFGPGRAKLFGNSADDQLKVQSESAHLDYVVVREGKNLKGRFLGVVLGTVGKRVLAKAFANSVKAIEARNAAAMVEHA